jgi:quercetin dioxygenase-like cupin family protein
MITVRRWERAHAPREAELRAELEAEGYSVYAWTDGPGATYPPHTHGEDQSHWVLRGSLSLSVAGNEYVLGPGDRDWLPAGTVHSVRVVDGPVTYLIASKRE